MENCSGKFSVKITLLNNASDKFKNITPPPGVFQKRKGKKRKDR